jgi:dTDP-4-amino-4,6-dideoxygalactose transaminase
MNGGAPVREDFLVFGAPLIGEEEIDEVVATLRSGWIGFGPKCQRFETEFARYVRRDHAVSLSSCTAGLQLALVLSDVGVGDEVITTPLTFAATVNVIELAGATPVFVDVERDTQNIDAGLIDDAITDRTRAVIPVHLYGRPCDMNQIAQTARRNDLTVIEDAAHAVESQRGAGLGPGVSRFATFSFYATKNITTGEGGMLACSDAEDADRARRLRLHGLTRNAWQRYTAAGWSPYSIVEPGFKANMTDLQASMGLHQLARIEQSLTVRERHWRAYDDAFAGMEEIEIPAPAREGGRHARHLYTLLLRPDMLTASRETVLSALQAEGVGTGVHFYPVHLHPYYAEKYGFRQGMFPNAEYVGDNTISLPLSARLSDADVADVIHAVKKVVSEFRKVRVSVAPLQRIEPLREEPQGALSRGA